MIIEEQNNWKGLRNINNLLQPSKMYHHRDWRKQQTIAMSLNQTAVYDSKVFLTQYARDFPGPFHILNYKELIKPSIYHHEKPRDLLWALINKHLVGTQAYEVDVFMK